MLSNVNITGILAVQLKYGWMSLRSFTMLLCLLLKLWTLESRFYSHFHTEYFSWFVFFVMWKTLGRPGVISGGKCNDYNYYNNFVEIM